MSTKLSRTEMLESMKARDASCDGLFFVGVKTMKIYCLPSCKAKLPLEKNVVFFFEQALALASDYRPCLRCKPNLFPNSEPAGFESLSGFVDAFRRQFGVSPGSYGRR